MSGVTRFSRPGDEGELRILWQTVFGDGDAVTDAFFSTAYKPGRAAVRLEDGRIVSAAYRLPLGRFSATGEAVRLIYAVATLPEYRSRGFGAELVREAIGDSLCVLCPAEESLFSYYAHICGAKTVFFARTLTGAADGGYIVRPVSPAEYHALRERFLRDIPHVELCEDMLRYQLALSSISGGGLFAAEKGNEIISCAAVEVYDGKAHIKELIGSADSAPSFARHMGAASFVARVPDISRSTPDAMLCRYDETVHSTVYGYVGPRFD